MKIPKGFRTFWRSLHSECKLPNASALVQPKQNGEVGSMLKYNQPFPAVPEGENTEDIVGIRFTVFQGGNPVSDHGDFTNPQILPKDATQTDFLVEDNKAEVYTKFEYYDDAEEPNYSEHPSQGVPFIPRDLIPPANPGDMPEPKLVAEVP